MKTLRFLSIILAFTAVDACHAAVINLTSSGVFTSLRLFYSSTVSNFANFTSASPPGDLTASVDDVADIATFTNAELGVVTDAFNRTFERTITTVTPPTNFPDPPIVVTTPLTETITIDSTSLPVQFVSSTTAPINYFQRSTYVFFSNVNMMFPEFFTVTGTYKVEGPTQTFTSPFNVRFRRNTTGEVFRANWNGFIHVGPDYPETAIFGASNVFTVYPTYTPTTMNIFQGIVDGIAVTANFTGATTDVRLPIPVPEPLAIWLWGLAMVGLSRFLFR
jgi:hypothetical protein